MTQANPIDKPRGPDGKVPEIPPDLLLNPDEQDVRSRATEALQNVRAQGEELADNLMGVVQKHLGVSLAVALGLGVLAGLALTGGGRQDRA